MVTLQATSAIKLFKARCTAGSCFLAGTQVVTGVDANGVFSTKSIEDLQVGDTVLARDEFNAGDDLDSQKVTQVFRETSDQVHTRTIAGDGGTIGTLRTTDEHPFFARDRGWLAAGELRPGDRFQQPDGSWQEVLDSEREALPDGVAVYSLEVEADHTYFVADAETSFTNPVWVHNTCRDQWRPKGARIKHAIQNPEKWKVVQTETKGSTNSGNRGGTSVQELVQNEDTGGALVYHTLYRADGSVVDPPHFRDEGR